MDATVPIQFDPTPTLNVAVLRFPAMEPEPLARAMNRAWDGLLDGRPTPAYGSLVYRFKNQAATCAIVNAGFIEIRTNQNESAPILLSLGGAVLSQDELRMNLGMSTEFGVRLTLSEAPDDFNVADKLMQLVSQPLDVFTEATGCNVDAVGARLYLEFGGSDGLYTYDVNPDVHDPERNLAIRLKSRRRGPVTYERYERAILKDLELVGRLVRAAPLVVSITG